MEVSKARLIELFTQLGINAEGWDKKRILRRLQRINNGSPDAMGDGGTPEARAAILVELAGYPAHSLKLVD